MSPAKASHRALPFRSNCLSRLRAAGRLSSASCSSRRRKVSMRRNSCSRRTVTSCTVPIQRTTRPCFVTFRCEPVLRRALWCRPDGLPDTERCRWSCFEQPPDQPSGLVSRSSGCTRDSASSTDLRALLDAENLRGPGLKTSTSPTRRDQRLSGQRDLRNTSDLRHLLGSHQIFFAFVELDVVS